VTTATELEDKAGWGKDKLHSFAGRRRRPRHDPQTLREQEQILQVLRATKHQPQFIKPIRYWAQMRRAHSRR
jgi:hypothetical protein